MTYTRINDQKQQRFSHTADCVVWFITGFLAATAIGLVLQEVTR